MNANQSDLIKTARTTGVWYLLLAISGVMGFMMFHSKIYVADDAAKTLANLSDQESLARTRLLFEFAIIVSQALAAVWFYRLFRNFSEWGAWALGIWGTVNAVAIMVSAIAMGVALDVAHSSVQSYEDKVVMIDLLSLLITHAWGVGSLFFGLWLIPMGYVVVQSQAMPVWLGRTLIIGGVGYIVSAVLKYTGVTGSTVDALVMPATIGEFWMIGYLLIFGVRPAK